MALSECHDSESWSALRNQRLAGPVREPRQERGAAPFAATRVLADLTPHNQTGSRSLVHAREPIQGAAFGVGDSQDEQVVLVLFESDQVRKPLNRGLADQRTCCLPAGPCRIGFWESPIRPREAETSAMNSSPNPGRRSSYHSAALRSSARASGCSSKRTSLLEFLQDLGPRSIPAARLNATFSDLS
jgi:hypothetical protein